jgi:predicted nucleic acid-binding protein
VTAALILEHLSSVPLVVPDRDDHVQAAELRNACGRAGTQVGTIDALVAQICIRHTLTLLSTDKGFERIANHTALRVWRP